MTIDLKRRTTFDTVAQRYDEMRPGYPSQLFDDIIDLASLPADGRILEIGSGTGKATDSFAARGYAVHCLELGANMADVAIHKFRAYPEIEIEVTSFEEWPLEEKAFDLVFSAQAFHWIPLEVAYLKAAAALKPSGSLALCWNLYPPDNMPLRDELNEIYAREAPEIVDRVTSKEPSTLIAQVETHIRDSGVFEAAEVNLYPWSAVHTGEEYVKLLGTYSDHISLPDATRQNLFANIRALIDEAGGTIERPYLAVLFCAKVRHSSDD